MTEHSKSKGAIPPKIPDSPHIALRRMARELQRLGADISDESDMGICINVLYSYILLGD